MFNSLRYKAFLCPLMRRYSLQFSLKFCASTSDAHSFAASYLINNCGFSPESAFKASKHVRFKTSEKPDSVLAFFRNHGFSDSHIYSIVGREPWLLSCDPNKTLSPKFGFLLSKGAFTSDIVRLVTVYPKFLERSLENHIIPTYKLVNRFLKSDKKTIACLTRHWISFSYSLTAPNVKSLIDYGVGETSIARLLCTRPSILHSTNLLKAIEEVKDLGFDPSKITFGVALIAKKAVSKIRWDEKIDVFKKWGWSDETILEAFRRQPNCMLASSSKINVVMSFWVNQLGWNSLALVKGSNIFGLSLEKRIIPRASVVQFLLKKGLRKKNASLIQPFTISEKLFQIKFVKCFEEQSSHLLRLYGEKLNLAYNRENTGMSPSPNM